MTFASTGSHTENMAVYNPYKWVNVFVDVITDMEEY